MIRLNTVLSIPLAEHINNGAILRTFTIDSFNEVDDFSFGIIEHFSFRLFGKNYFIIDRETIFESVDF